MQVDFVICSPFPYHLGGREVWLSHIARELARQESFKVRVWALERRAAGVELDYGAGLGVELRPVRSLTSSVLLRRAARVLLGRGRALVDWYVFSRAAARGIARLGGRGEGPGVVVTVGSVSEGLAGRWVRAEGENAPAFVCSVRGRAALDTAPYYGLLCRRVVLGWEEAAFRAADLIVANGRETVDYVGSRGFCAELQPNGVDFALFASGGAGLDQEDAEEVMGDRSLRYVLSTCTVADSREIRGVAWRLRAVPRLREIWGDGFRMIFIGTGDGRQYRGLVRELGIGDLVRFCGARRNVAGFLARADVVTCLVTEGGGMSQAALEAMAAGRPIAATDNDIYRQMLEYGKSALLVPANDADALARAIADLFSDPERGAELGRRAQEIAQQYDWPEVTRVFAGHLRTAVERRRASGTAA